MIGGGGIVSDLMVGANAVGEGGAPRTSGGMGAFAIGREGDTGGQEHHSLG